MMRAIRVIQPGFQSTVQDLGRFGYSHLGISASGAADPVSMRIGNTLVGNDQNAASVEMTLTGGEFYFESSAVISITGSDFSPAVDGVQISLWRSHFVDAGSTLKLSHSRSGARCYLCVRGGFETEKILGSYSTHLLTGIGGVNGRALKKGDILNYYPAGKKDYLPVKVKDEILKNIFSIKNIFVTKAPQTDYFSEDTAKLFSFSPYLVTEEANRMGLRLSGPKLERKEKRDMITEGISLGAIQVSNGGDPIISFVEHQTTGGYPVIANVISADIYKIGQMRPRDEINFSFIEIEEAYKKRKLLESLISQNSFRLI